MGVKKVTDGPMNKAFLGVGYQQTKGDLGSIFRKYEFSRNFAAVNENEGDI